MTAAELLAAYARGERVFADAYLADANLAGAKLAGAYLAGANLAGATLAGVNIDGQKRAKGKGQRKVFDCGHRGLGAHCHACGIGQRVQPRKLTDAERADKARKGKAS